MKTLGLIMLVIALSGCQSPRDASWTLAPAFSEQGPRLPSLEVPFHRSPAIDPLVFEPVAAAPPFAFSDAVHVDVILDEAAPEIMADVVDFTLFSTPIEYAFGEHPSHVVYHLRLR